MGGGEVFLSSANPIFPDGFGGATRAGYCYPKLGSSITGQKGVRGEGGRLHAPGRGKGFRGCGVLRIPLTPEEETIGSGSVRSKEAPYQEKDSPLRTGKSGTSSA